MGKLYLFYQSEKSQRKEKTFRFFSSVAVGLFLGMGLVLQRQQHPPQSGTVVAYYRCRTIQQPIALEVRLSRSHGRRPPTRRDATRPSCRAFGVRGPSTRFSLQRRSIKVSAGALEHSFDGGRGPFKKIDSVNCKHIGRDVTRASVKTTSAVRMARRLVTTCNQQFGHSASFNANTTVE